MKRSTSIERTGEAHGFAYEVIALSEGWRCGYVRIPEGHPLFGVGYNSPAPGYTKAAIENEPIGKRGIFPLIVASLDDDGLSLELLFDVHGSLTFSGERNEKGDWWLGFDCAHAGDGKDESLMTDPRLLEIHRRFHFGDDDPVRTAEYVEAECISLARQIAERYPVEVTA